ncbi:substrate-binding domain-containing protein [Rhizohabitans arisaemae]|uniref:substrate-binding domain-containing protein n=1 Tax=Rhizohabitans arisaemae TaxID=2720610 RepID=UPI0024B1FAB8|nr:substrate-binding domain-containing protein [Rhizohabitans arisaemae]
MRWNTHVAAIAVIATMTVLVSGCTSSTEGSAEATKVALLLPENQTARWEQRDKPAFEAELAKACPTCELLYFNAGGDAAKQLSQVESALTEGADLLVITPVDSTASAPMVALADAQKVPVVSYGRVINDGGADFAVRFDNVEQGRVGARALVDKLAADGVKGGNVVMINGDARDSVVGLMKQGARAALQSGYTIAAEFDTPDWSAENAQRQMQQSITKLGLDGIVGVYVANDGMAAGVIAALKGVGADPIPPVTGLDAQLDAVQRIVAGDQYASVFLDIEEQARITAKIASAMVRGEAVPAALQNGTTDDGSHKVPSFLQVPVPVTVTDIQKVLIDSGYLKVEEICTSEYKAACDKAGLRQP